MIAFVSGVVRGVAPDAAVVEVGGVGLAVRCTPTTLATLRVGQPARLSTSLVVREDSLTLYGFADDDEREVFDLVQTASGVGPKLALAMLAVHRPDGLRRAVAEGDIGALMLVPGIGRKGAMKIALELKDRLGPATGAGGLGEVALGASDGWRAQVHAGLLGLGWSTREADEAVRVVAPEADAARAEGREPVVAELLKSALRALSRA